jgi:hypothetical protein
VKLSLVKTTYAFGIEPCPAGGCDSDLGANQKSGVNSFCQIEHVDSDIDVEGRHAATVSCGMADCGVEHYVLRHVQYRVGPVL